MRESALFTYFFKRYRKFNACHLIPVSYFLLYGNLPERYILLLPVYRAAGQVSISAFSGRYGLLRHRVLYTKKNE